MCLRLLVQQQDCNPAPRHTFCRVDGVGTWGSCGNLPHGLTRPLGIYIRQFPDTMCLVIPDQPKALGHQPAAIIGGWFGYGQCTRLRRDPVPHPTCDMMDLQDGDPPIMAGNSRT